MQPAVYDLDVYKGDTHKWNFTIKSGATAGSATPVDLTGYTASAEIRDTVASGSAAATFTCTIPTPVNGVVQMVLPAAQSAGLTGSEDKVWDLQLTNGSGEKYTYLKGAVHITGEVTRP